MGYFTKWARFFNLGNSGRAVYEKPLGPQSNPINSVYGSAGIPVIRTMYSLKPAIVLQGQTLTLDSVAGTASQVLIDGARLSHLNYTKPSIVGITAPGGGMF